MKYYRMKKRKTSMICTVLKVLNFLQTLPVITIQMQAIYSKVFSLHTALTTHQIHHFLMHFSKNMQPAEGPEVQHFSDTQQQIRHHNAHLTTHVQTQTVIIKHILNMQVQAPLITLILTVHRITLRNLQQLHKINNYHHKAKP